jgi:hypothetical protein
LNSDKTGPFSFKTDPFWVGNAYKRISSGFDIFPTVKGEHSRTDWMILFTTQEKENEPSARYDFLRALFGIWRF